MNITILGAGNMGSALVKQLSNAGHRIRVTARNMEKAKALSTQYSNVVAATPQEALADSEVVIIATGYGDAISALHQLGDLSGRIVIDITNPLTDDYMGLTIGHSTSAAEEIAKVIPNAIVVKAFNTVFAQVLSNGPQLSDGNRVPVFFATDNEKARQVIRSLIDSIQFKAVDTGGLKNARYLEPMAGLNIYLGYGAGQGTGITPAWIGVSQ